MATVAVITTLGKQFGLRFPKNQFDNAIFDSVGSLLALISGLLDAEHG